jgi:hypothetical protein
VKKFAIMRDMVENLTYTNENILVRILSTFDMIHQEHHFLIREQASIQPQELLGYRKIILRNLALSILLRHLGMSEDMVYQFIRNEGGNNDDVIVSGHGVVDIISYYHELKDTIVSSVPFMIQSDTFHDDFPEFIRMESLWRSRGTS